MKTSHNIWLNAWYGKSKWIYCLLPLSWLFAVIVSFRKFFLVHFLQKSFSVPVIVVGNISVGGTGKTPLIIALVNHLQQLGHKPGVVSRGYGGHAPYYPYLVDKATRVHESGDEPLLIFKATDCPVCVAPDRIAAVQMLIEQGCTIILSDDGLQHYRLGRAIEIAVVDGQRLFGNGYRLPAGPLREPVSRLNDVDLIVVNNSGPQLPSILNKQSFSMQIQPLLWTEIYSRQIYPLDKVAPTIQVDAVAGIGNPERFFNTLDTMALHYIPHCFSDHHQFTLSDFADCAGPVVMTEKDAVKCQDFARPEWYALKVGALLAGGFWQELEQKISSVQSRAGH